MDTILTKSLRFKAKVARGRAAFGLIEVIIAIAIISLSFVGILGMMCSGLYLCQMGFQVTTSSQIAQEVANSVQQTEYSQLSQLQNQTYYFDNQGNQLTAANQSQAIFQANLAIGSVQLPGTSCTNSNLTTVTVRVAYSPAGTVINWAAPPAGLSIQTYTTTVANDN